MHFHSAAINNLAGAKMSGSVSQHDREREWRTLVRGEKKLKEEPVIAVLQMLSVFIREMTVIIGF